MARGGCERTGEELGCSLLVYQPVVAAYRRLQRGVERFEIDSGGNDLTRLRNLCRAGRIDGKGLGGEDGGRERDGGTAQGRGVDVGHGGLGTRDADASRAAKWQRATRKGASE